MPFQWNRPYQENLLERYPPETIGRDAWADLIGRLRPAERAAPSAELVSTWLDAFDEFIREASVDADQKARPNCRIFVSHKQQDVAYAERIAFLATRHGLDYWLDVHDLNLVLAQQTLQPNDPRLPIVIAAIIEIGLLNSTHVVAVHTSNSSSSKWIPYEFGRAKARRIRSDQAAGWLEPTLRLSACGEYIRLAFVAHGGESDLEGWMRKQRCQKVKLNWPYPKPAPLP